MTSPEWLELRVHWPERCELTFPRTGDDAHRLAAKAVASAGADPRCAIAPELMHHAVGPEGPTPKNGLSPIRFAAARDSMSITAVGNEAVDVLEGSGHRLTRAISRMAGTPLKETWRRGALRLSLSPRLRLYRVSHFLLSRKPAKALKHGADISTGALTPALRAWIEARILEGIHRQAGLVGMPELSAEPTVRLVEANGFGGWVREGVFYGCLAHEVIFASDLALSGPWAVGSLCLLGAGRVTPVRTLEGHTALAA